MNFDMNEINKYSKVLTQDETQPAAQAMLYGIGLSDEDMQKAQVGIVSKTVQFNIVFDAVINQLFNLPAG